MAEFWEAYKRPEWQKKRLDILNRDGWRCVECGDSDSELHVHHHYYESGRQPWEYDDWTLKTLCPSCHLKFGVLSRHLRSLLSSASISTYLFVAGCAQGAMLLRGDKDHAVLSTNDHHNSGLSAILGMSISEMRAKAEDGDVIRKHHLPQPLTFVA